MSFLRLAFTIIVAVFINATSAYAKERIVFADRIDVSANVTPEMNVIANCPYGETDTKACLDAIRDLRDSGTGDFVDDTGKSYLLFDIEEEKTIEK